MLTPTSPSTSSTGAGQGSSADTLLPAAGRELTATVRSVASSGTGGETFRIQVEVNSRLLELTTRAPLNQGDRILLQRSSGGELQIRLPAPAPAAPQGQTASAPNGILLQLTSTDRQLQQLLPLNSARTAQVISSEPAAAQPPSSAPGSPDATAARPTAGNPGAARSPLPTANTPTPPAQPAAGTAATMVQTGSASPSALASTTPATTASDDRVYSARLQSAAAGSTDGQRSPSTPVQSTGPATPATSAPAATPATTTYPAAPATPTTPTTAAAPANPSATPAANTTPAATSGSTNPAAPATPAPQVTPTTTPAPPAASTTPARTPGSTGPTIQTTPAPPAPAPATTPATPSASAATPAAPATEAGGQAGVSLRGQALLQTLGQQPAPRTDSHLIGLSINNQTFSLISPRPLLSGQQVALTRISDQQVSLQPLPPTSGPAEDAGARQQMQQALREALPRQIPFADALNQMVQLSQGSAGRSQSAIGQLVQSMLSMFSVTPGSADAEQAIQRNLQQGGLLTESRLAQGGKSEQGAPADLKQQLGQLLKAAEKLPPDARQQLTRLVESLQARSTTRQISSLQAWKEQPDGTQERVYRLDLPIRQADHHDNAELTITEQRRRNSQGEPETLWGAALHFDLEEYGPLDARLSLSEGWRLQIQFWAEEAFTLRQIERRLDEFSDDLHRQGFLVESLQARQGRPSQPELTDIQQRLVDIHT